MSRFGGQVDALALFGIATSPDPWRTLVSIDGQGPGLTDQEAPRVLRVWASRGFQSIVRSFRLRLTFGAGDITNTREIGAVGEYSVPTQGGAFPVPAGNVRVDVAFTQGLLPPDPGTQIFGTVTSGAPVLTWLPGSLAVANPAAAQQVFLDPEDYPFAAILRVASYGLSNDITFDAFAPVNLKETTVDLPFVGTVRLANALGGAVYYQIGVIS